MSEYAYKAKTPNGRIRSGTLRGTSKAVVKSHLHRMNLRPLYIKATKLDKAPDEIKGFLSNFVTIDEKGRILITLFGPKSATAKDLIVFTKQFATMLKSGVPLIQALDVLARQQRVRSFGEALKKVRTAVENGATLSETMETFPKLFDNLYVSMVRAGETGGNLDEILFELVTYIEKAAKIKAQVKSAMMYPTIVILVAILVITGLLVFVVPAMAKQYTEANKELPGLTQFIIDMSNGMVHNWYLILGGIFSLVSFLKMWSKTKNGKQQLDAIYLKIPGIGNLIHKVAIGRFCSTMASMLTSGVNLLEALNICAASAGNWVIERSISTIRQKMEQGQKFSEPLAESGLFPPMVVSMVAVGEATGALDEMLLKVSEFYEDEVDLAVKTLISMIEPFLIVFIGVLVAFVVIGMYLPVFDLGSVVGG